jgi:ATP-dependent protease HslVU (ClpYQ) peptidase subunit
MIQLLRFAFNPPKIHPDTDIYKYMCTEFVDALRNCFKNGGFAKKQNEEESGGTFLVAHKNRLFEIEDDYQVAETYDDFGSVGCGAKYALGALMVMPDNTKPETKVTKALEVATHFSAGVRPPFVIETT